MPDEQLYAQQLNEERAQQSQLQAQDRARQKPGWESPKSPEISGIEFALIFLVAALKDIIDGGATISVFGMPLTTIVNVLAVLILWFWCIIKLQRFPTKRFVSSAIIESIPILGALPMWTLFVLTLYLEHLGLSPAILRKMDLIKKK